VNYSNRQISIVLDNHVRVLANYLRSRLFTVHLLVLRFVSRPTSDAEKIPAVKMGNSEVDKHDGVASDSYDNIHYAAPPLSVTHHGARNSK